MWYDCQISVQCALRTIKHLEDQLTHGFQDNEYMLLWGRGNNIINTEWFLRFLGITTNTETQYNFNSLNSGQRTAFALEPRGSCAHAIIKEGRNKYIAMLFVTRVNTFLERARSLNGNSASYLFSLLTWQLWITTLHDYFITQSKLILCQLMHSIISVANFSQTNMRHRASNLKRFKNFKKLIGPVWITLPWLCLIDKGNNMNKWKLEKKFLRQGG